MMILLKTMFFKMTKMTRSVNIVVIIMPVLITIDT